MLSAPATETMDRSNIWQCQLTMSAINLKLFLWADMSVRSVCQECWHCRPPTTHSRLLSVVGPPCRPIVSAIMSAKMTVYIVGRVVRPLMW